MTDKIEKIRAALEAHQHGCESLQDMAEDMAQIVLAAMPILQWSDDMTTQAAASGEVWHEPAPIAAFRKAVEEKTDD